MVTCNFDNLNGNLTFSRNFVEFFQNFREKLDSNLG